MENKYKNVAIQGFRASFHEEAALKFFGESLNFSMHDSFRSLFSDVVEENVDYGVVAIENTVAGTILPNYALLRESKVQVIGEVYLQIKQNLMALPGQRVEDLLEVQSHPMAIQQCYGYLEQYPNLKLIESPDTALSAALIREKNLKGVAAIASMSAAKLYELEVLAESIETNKRNYTRFLIIKPGNYQKTEAEMGNKASLTFHLAHKTGSLSQILALLAYHKINLTKIQSLPLLGREWEYFFHIDCEFSNYQRFKEVMKQIGEDTEEFQLLGTYKKKGLSMIKKQSKAIEI